MLQRRFFSHTNPEGLTAGERLLPFYSGPVQGWAENIWEGSNLSAPDNESLARTMMNFWISSPGHRQNLLKPDYTHLGVGVAASGREIRAAQLFATSRLSAEPFQSNVPAPLLMTGAHLCLLAVLSQLPKVISPPSPVHPPHWREGE